MEEVKISDVMGITIFSIHDKMLFLIGVNLTRAKQKPYIVLLQVLLSSISLVANCMVVVFTMRAVIHSIRRGEVNPVTHGILRMLVCVSTIQKYAVAMRCQENIIRVGEFMLRNRQQGRKEGSTVEAIIKHCTMHFYYGMVGVIFFLWIPFPFLRRYAPEPPPMEYPFPEHISEWIDFPLNCIANVFIFVNTSYVCAVAYKSMAFLVAQLQDLKREISGIDGKETASKIKEAVKRHNEIIKLYQDVAKIMSEIFLFQRIISTILNPVFIFALQLTAYVSKNLIEHLPVGFLVTIELIIMCKLGEEITQEFLDIQRAIYFVPWYTFKKEEKRHILMIQEIAKKRFRILGGGVFAADLHTYVQVFQNAFSFYVLVKTVLSA